MIFPFPRDFPADAVEALVPDAASARALVRERRPDVLRLLDARRTLMSSMVAADTADRVERAESAVLIAFCRLAFRHGSWGDDFHAYHNEGHVLEILGSRIDRLLHSVGPDALSLRDWFLLSLFAAAHDLRQRESTEFFAGIGSNERASVEETFRILLVCGFTPQHNPEIFQGIELMISGSTFDARPPATEREYNTADMVVESGGALAQKLDRKLDKHAAPWRDDARVEHALKLALIAADLDTANVAESFAVFMASAERLCLEREMRGRRDIASVASARSMLRFLTDGQEHYFFDLHRFSSQEGRTAFEPAKRANAKKLEQLARDLRERANEAVLQSGGEHILATFRELVAKSA